MKLREFLEFSYEPFEPKQRITPHEWDVLMTGSTKKEYCAGDYIIKQGEMNHFVYRLISGSVRIETLYKCAQWILVYVTKLLLVEKTLSLDNWRSTTKNLEKSAFLAIFRQQ